jgi:NAD(P)-dependent dehydrogenase (short-subunit alcohol dehydrogenase family)
MHDPQYRLAIAWQNVGYNQPPHPGFFLGEQNRRLLTQEDGSLTARGETICRNTPFGRFGQADELHGALHFLLSDASAFVTGTTVVVDGGFTAFSRV